MIIDNDGGVVYGQKGTVFSNACYNVLFTKVKHIIFQQHNLPASLEQTAQKKKSLDPHLSFISEGLKTERGGIKKAVSVSHLTIAK